MTYCVGLLLDQGLVMASDSRTNAGVDNIALYPRDQFSLSQRLKLEADAPELLGLTRSWEESQHRAFAALPPFAWEADAYPDQATLPVLA
ncbi:hypothetical protein U5801_23765 [Lamprobacter modestohalophilus]|nr:hypothetical protein [Lamprobacter modestohalophilus]MEA1052803.1 hypothetical protein [Lamprobacter modestohalophilus]